MREKRQHARAVLETSVRVIRRGREPVETVSRDISLGGMYVAGSIDAELGEEFTIYFELPKLGEVEVECFLRWKKDDGFGLQFGLMGPRETHAIGALVRSQQKSA